MQENQDIQERIRELEQEVEELKALIKSQAQTSNKNLLLKHLGQTPEEQIKNNQAAMNWAKERMQAIKDKWGDEWEN
ncbi:hypothetical protein [Planktothrix paucivesiculata]|uniref:Uncharacterized protein n=1 Tax=Planktothrix paucivesiculata PCC 9631 TaxID=671071 RepID=A0A7Z9BKM4_9CYAN|nr:hypothetical protein [Planktothrix paucivesiculata]VXD16055.1 conserved hypothetical protein [Planktothrix paucivesiculata PCC 9631]VXD17194.1 conserved hypothetical protein [Planktothrix paucivesiculata PCC 9631]